MNKLYKIAAAVALMAGGGLAALAAPPAPAGEPKTFAVLDKDGRRLADYTIPSDTLIDKEPNAEQIRYGQRLLNETRRLLPNNTGASLNCSSCHVQQGKKPQLARAGGHRCGFCFTIVALRGLPAAAQGHRKAEPECRIACLVRDDRLPGERPKP